MEPLESDDTEDPGAVQLPPVSPPPAELRYPRRMRAPPDRFGNYVEH